MKITRPQSKQPIPKTAKKVFGGVIFDVYQWQQKMFDGNYKTFEKLKRADTVIIFPVLDDGRILLSEQKQPGRGQSFIGGLGGGINRGETVLRPLKNEQIMPENVIASEAWRSIQPDKDCFTIVRNDRKMVFQRSLY